MPRVDDVRFLGAEEHADDIGHAAREGRVAFHDRAAHAPTCELTSTREGPSASDAEAAVHTDGLAERRKHAARDRVVRGIDFTSGIGAEVDAHEGGASADHRDPPRRSVCARDFFDHGEHDGDGRLASAELAGHEELEDTRVDERSNGLAREPSVGFDARSEGRDDRGRASGAFDGVVESHLV